MMGQSPQQEATTHGVEDAPARMSVTTVDSPPCEPPQVALTPGFLALKLWSKNCWIRARDVLFTGTSGTQSWKGTLMTFALGVGAAALDAADVWRAQAASIYPEATTAAACAAVCSARRRGRAEEGGSRE